MSDQQAAHRQTHVARRAFEIDLLDSDEYGNTIHDPARLAEWLVRMATVLTEVGGTLSLTAMRVKVGQMGDEPVALTEKIVARWQAQSPLRTPAPPQPDDAHVPEPASEPVPLPDDQE